MTANHTGAWFHTTTWGLVLSARADPGALELLLRAYWSPVYAFIRHKGYSQHDAADLTQEFLSEVILGRNLLVKADPARGRFRAFVKSALRNFLVDQHRRAGTQRAAPKGGMSDTDLDVIGDADASDPSSRAFDRQWAAAVLAITIERVEAACRQEGMMGKVKSPPMEELAARIGATSPAQVSNMIQTVKRRFRRTLRDVVTETVTDSAEAEAELLSLQHFFG
jgi:RNA polymerase sigma-70 factor (ECF subfamily)